MPRRLAIILLFLAATCPGAEPPVPPDDGARVAVLGYHEFSDTEPETQMRISTEKFRAQMETLRELDLDVISMAEFQAWKRGEATIPERSVMITIDDGWKSVYTQAFPILREFGHPFTLFLYKNYVDGGGRALTTPMIEEMLEHGATIGSHSVSHPFPATVKEHRGEGPDAYDEFLRTEMGESKRFLEAKFGDAVTTYAYPGGFQTREMHALADEFGYRQLFTVIPGKIKRSSNDFALPRYVILGTHDPIFDMAVRFSGPPNRTADPGEPPPTTPHPVEPDAGAVIDDRLPLISADLSEVPDLDPETLTMRVGGFGFVPATWNAEDGILSWQTNRRLRLPYCHVQITWKTEDGESPDTPLRWSFRLDQEAAYVPRD